MGAFKRPILALIYLGLVYVWGAVSQGVKTVGLLEYLRIDKFAFFLTHDGRMGAVKSRSQNRGLPEYLRIDKLAFFLTHDGVLFISLSLVKGGKPRCPRSIFSYK